MSAGTNIKTCEKEGTNPLEEWMLDWADIIYVMENKHKKEINKSVGAIFNTKIIVLNIPDVYKYYQKELIELLENKVKYEGQIPNTNEVSRWRWRQKNEA